MSSSVAVCRSCVSLRPIPNSTPCVKTVCPLFCPYAPLGANVTELLDWISCQLAGTLTWNRFPSLYVRKLEDGGSTRPVGKPVERPEVPVGRLERFLVACSVVGAG